MSLEILGDKPHRAILFGGSLVGVEVDNQFVKPLQGELHGGGTIIVEREGKFYLANLSCDKIVAGPFSTVQLAKKELLKRVEKQLKYDLVSPVADCQTPANRGLNLQLATAEVRAKLANEELMKEALEAALSNDVSERFLSSQAGGVQLRPLSSYGTGFTRATAQMDIALEERKEAIQQALQTDNSMDRYFSQAATEAAIQTIRINNPITNTTTTTTTFIEEDMEEEDDE